MAISSAPELVLAVAALFITRWVVLTSQKTRSSRLVLMEIVFHTLRPMFTFTSRPNSW